jgi:CubicO group peptidase (beta-lactamase class C family)/outer membrane lipoprotein-sorting protein
MEVKIMKRIFSLATASLFLITLIACQDSGQTAQQILEKMIEAQGGRNAAEGIKDMTWSGTIEMAAQGLSGPITIYKKEPDKIRVDIEVIGRVFSRAYDGKTGWGTNPQTGGIEEMSGQQLADIKKEAMPIVSLLNPEQYGITFAYKGKEEIEGKEYFVLEEAYPDGSRLTFYLDSITYLTFKVKGKTSGPQGEEVEFEQFQSDYKKVNGLLLAHSTVTYSSGKETQKITWEEVISNTGLEDSLFKMPQKTGQPDQLSVSEFVRELDAYLETSTEKDIFSGVVLFAREGKPIFKKAYGMADREGNIPNQLNTKFCIGSMGKMFTAVSIAQLVEQGKLSYDDLIGKYLGADWILPEVGEKVKISHLLSHTSGIAEFLDDEFYKFTEPGTHWTLEDRKPIVKEKSLTFEPGTRWAYCNIGFILLAAIIEKVTGRNISDYLKEHIFDPTGMDNTFDSYRKTTLSNVALGYDKVQEEGKAIWRKTGLFGNNDGTPSGGGFSTVDDFLKFAEALGSNLLISSESKELLMSAKPGLNSKNYGYGFWIERSRFGRVVGHGGVAPGVSANFRMFLDRGYTLITLSNYSEAMLPVARKIRSLLPFQ